MYGIRLWGCNPLDVLQYAISSRMAPQGNLRKILRLVEEIDPLEINQIDPQTIPALDIKGESEQEPAFYIFLIFDDD